ncbi:hypothetical protein G6F35_013960 [Rhizopus arrhizus]|nr:hypothetical protein G6F35_013960 [Rhizopus arrhizus]
MPLRAQIAAHLQQAAGRVPAVRGVAVRTRRHQHEVSDIDPDVVVVELAAFTVDGRIALLVALHVDLEIVVFHRDGNAHRARHVQHRAIAQQTALRGLDGDLAAGGQRDRARREIHRARAADLHPRQFSPVGPRRQQRRIALHRRRHAQAVALAVQRQGAAAVQQNRRGAVLGHRDPAVRARRGQVHRAARIDRRARQHHAALHHVATRQRHVARGSLDQTGLSPAANSA